MIKSRKKRGNEEKHALSAAGAPLARRTVTVTTIVAVTAMAGLIVSLFSTGLVSAAFRREFDTAATVLLTLSALFFAWRMRHFGSRALISTASTAADPGLDISAAQSRAPDLDLASLAFENHSLQMQIQARARAEEKYRRLFENAAEGIYIASLDGKIVHANPALSHMLGYSSPEELIERVANVDSDIYVDPVLRDRFRREMMDRSPLASLESQMRRRDGSSIWISENARLVCDENGQPLHFEGFVQDISTRKAVEAERERLLADALERADRDPLTGLLNHRAFHRHFDEESDRTRREGKSLVVAVMDLDNFKFFNDAYGHVAGDEVLREVARVLRQTCRTYDTVARFSGDEFVLLMPGMRPEEAFEFKGRLYTRLKDAGFRPEGYDSTIPLSLSIGIAVYPDEATTRLEVLDLADSRLRRTKTGGGDTDEADRLRNSLLRSMDGFSMLDALVSAVHNKDRYTRRHSEDVMAYSLEIVDELGFDEQFRRTVAIAALLHDVGKIGVPDHILRKPAALTAEEFEAVKLHPIMGAAIVAAVPGFENTLDAVRYHHERWDGQGYPDGLRSEDTPLIARLMAVADAYSAMTTDRPYRKGMPAQKALAIIAQGAGVQWDPNFAEAFLRVRQGLPTRSRIQPLKAA